MTYEEYYGDMLPVLKQTEKYLLDLINKFQTENPLEGVEPIIYCTSRIKAPESLKTKLELNGYSADRETALREMHDIVGIRVICSFADDVYDVVNWLCGREEFEVVTQKDYIARPKPNGYRSYHLILNLKEGAGKGLKVEIQVRTIATDFWAALEHQIKYKHDVKNEKMIREELKRCADEIASVDMSMQTIRDIIREES
ncbi:MAG: RelA/SpoT domain protein [Clostridiales bacterium]|nr:RelA/SpoT domain protein [Clostridiales bacterium]MCD8158404.1 RelA/SpoT domain protein [Clostridiales bacterium]